MATSPTGVIEKVPAGMVRPGNNDRTRFDAESIAELAGSIDAHGLAQPITVRPADDGFTIVAGERRFRAMTEILGWESVPAIVRDLGDAEASAIMLAENVARADLDPIDEARAYQTRVDRYALSVGAVAQMAGVTTARVTTRLPLLRLVEEAQDLVRVGQLSINHGRVLACLDGNRQRIALAALNKRNLDYFAFRDLCARLYDEQCAEPMFDPDDFLRIEEYAAEAAEGRAAKKRSKVQMIRALADALEAAGLCPELVAEARGLTESPLRGAD